MNILEVSGLHKTFGKHEVLKGIDFTLEKGQVLSIIGRSGGGKTTLLRCINGLEKAETGVIRIGGESFFDAEVEKTLSAKEKREKQRKVGMVFQSYNLFPQYTVLDNVTLACRLAAKERPDYRQRKEEILGEIDENARQLIGKVGLTEKIDFYPCQLSGGQQQRVAIARALATGPDLLCFDEPTSALDPQLTKEVLRVIRALAEDKMTMVVVTHEMKFAREISDQVIYMEDGRITVRGTAEEVFNSADPRFRAFLGDSEEGDGENDVRKAP